MSRYTVPITLELVIVEFCYHVCKGGISEITSLQGDEASRSDLIHTKDLVLRDLVVSQSK